MEDKLLTVVFTKPADSDYNGYPLHKWLKDKCGGDLDIVPIVTGPASFELPKTSSKISETEEMNRNSWKEEHRLVPLTSAPQLIKPD